MKKILLSVIFLLWAASANGATIYGLTALSTVASGDLFIVIDVDDTTMSANGTDKKVTLADLTTAITSELTLNFEASDSDDFDPDRLDGDGTDDGLIDQDILEGFAASASPSFTFKDSDCLGTDKEVGKILVNYIDGADGSENADLSLQAMQDGSEVTFLLFDESDDQIEISKLVELAGDLKVLGDDIFMTTNTNGYFLLADGTNYNPANFLGGTFALTGSWDFGGGTVEIPNGTSDVALGAAGVAHLNTTDEQLSFHSAADGEISGEVALSLIHHRVWSFDPDSICDGAVDRLFLMTIGDDAPEGITITEWKLSFEADPTTEVDLDLKYADAFIGVANAAVIDVLDTTNGVSTEDTNASINGGAAVANGKVLYLEFGTAYTETGHQCIFELWYYTEED